jgi:hypothetical protein
LSDEHPTANAAKTIKLTCFTTRLLC